MLREPGRFFCSVPASRGPLRPRPRGGDGAGMGCQKTRIRQGSWAQSPGTQRQQAGRSSGGNTGLWGAEISPTHCLSPGAARAPLGSGGSPNTLRATARFGCRAGGSRAVPQASPSASGRPGLPRGEAHEQSGSRRGPRPDGAPGHSHRSGALVGATGAVPFLLLSPGLRRPPKRPAPCCRGLKTRGYLRQGSRPLRGPRQQKITFWGVYGVRQRADRRGRTGERQQLRPPEGTKSFPMQISSPPNDSPLEGIYALLGWTSARRFRLASLQTLNRLRSPCGGRPETSAGISHRIPNVAGWKTSVSEQTRKGLRQEERAATPREGVSEGFRKRPRGPPCLRRE